MSSLTLHPPIQNVVAKAPFIDRTHFNGPSAGAQHGHYSSKGGSKGKHSLALTALTLLAFLFFLNILQNCLDDHMKSMNQPMIVMQSRTQEVREIEAEKRKGDAELHNSSHKESRHDPDEKNVKPQDSYVTQIQVKLRTNEKAVKP